MSDTMQQKLLRIATSADGSSDGAKRALVEAAARISELEAALRPFARVAEMESKATDGASVMVNVSRCRDARQALGAKP